MSCEIWWFYSNGPGKSFGIEVVHSGPHLGCFALLCHGSWRSFFSSGFHCSGRATGQSDWNTSNSPFLWFAQAPRWSPFKFLPKTIHREGSHWRKVSKVWTSWQVIEIMQRPALFWLNSKLTTIGVHRSLFTTQWNHVILEVKPRWTWMKWPKAFWKSNCDSSAVMIRWYWMTLHDHYH